MKLVSITLAWTLLIFSVLPVNPLYAGTARVSSQAEFELAVKQAGPGDVIELANGTWNDFEIAFVGEGTADQPITLTAQEKGKVFISGRSNLRLAGEHLVVSGLVFKNGYTPTSEVISFRRDSEQLANYSRVTDVVIDRFNNPERTEVDYWVVMYGRNNRFDHNHVAGKSNQGVTIAVRLNTEASQANHHRVDHNYFGPRPVLGSNGGETLRIGTSHYSMSNSFTLVENNYFDRCDGEVEIISNKSGSNVFRGNVFFESRGTLTLRHGHDSLVENNVFLGNGVDHTGGIRVINKRQTVRNNYLEGLRGYRFGSALTLMNGVPDSPINRYHQVEDSVIENNTLVDVAHIELAAGSDEERSATPLSTRFANNLLVNSDGNNPITAHDDISGITFSGNVGNVDVRAAVNSGFTQREIELQRGANGLMQAEGLDGVGAAPDLAVLQREATGVNWYPKPRHGPRFGTGSTVSLRPGADLAAAIEAAKAGDVLELAPGSYRIERMIVLDRPLTLRAAGSDKPTIEFERSTLFEIAQGGSLRLEGLHISGKQAPDSAGNSLLRTSRYSMLGGYELQVVNCRISDLDVNHSFNFLTSAKSTFADNIEIIDSEFSDISGAVLELDKETDDLGLYNAEYVTIANSSFKNVGKSLLTIYRGGTDESTFGPHVSLRSNTLTDVGRSKRNRSGASILMHGVQVADIDNNAFNDSAPVRVVETVGEPITRFANNEWTGTDEPVMSSTVATMPQRYRLALEKAKDNVDPFLAELPDIPVPADAGGGYTHEQHKRNQAVIAEAGVLYQETGNPAYVALVRDMLLAYADMYPDLPLHPKQKEQSPGKLFWQSLNEAVWLVNVIQGYEKVLPALTAQDREAIEAGLFHPLVKFISVDAPQTFDRIHNHGTWAVAATGITGYVLGNEDYVERALYGLKKDGSAGFLKQLDQLFSPDGYYSEGPYYQRYALMPFVLFADAVERNEPERELFAYRDSVLLKAVYTTIHLSYAGLFFPINDAIKDKGIDTVELCHGVAIAWGLTGDPSLLSIAEQQNRIVLTDRGRALATALENVEAQPFPFDSRMFRDGAKGDEGALSVLRSGPEPGHQALVFKATSQGMEHGHFDKLSWIYYDNGNEVVRDYGAARFLNVVDKYGGHYLPENNTWAKQTIAHNTLVVDGQSHFQGELREAEKHHPEILAFETGGEVEVTAARMADAYKDVDFLRAQFLLQQDVFAQAAVLDVVKAAGSETHQFDLPLYFSGQITSISHEVEAATTSMEALGTDNGYQHLWKRAVARVPEGETFRVTWLLDNRFYSYSVVADATLEVIFTETGAGDPNFNLVPGSGLLLRAVGTANVTFVSLLEPHGEYNGSREYTVSSQSNVAALEHVASKQDDKVRVRFNAGDDLVLGISWDPNPDQSHRIKTAGSSDRWKGFFALLKGGADE